MRTGTGRAKRLGRGVAETMAAEATPAAPRTSVVRLPLGAGAPYVGQYVRPGEYGVCCYCGTSVRSARLRAAPAEATAGGRLLYGEVAGRCADEAWCLLRRRERNLDQATLDAYWGASGTKWESVLDATPSASCPNGAASGPTNPTRAAERALRLLDADPTPRRAP